MGNSKRALRIILSDRLIAYHGTFAKIMGSAAGGVWLSQIMYWDSVKAEMTTKNGEEYDGWFYKSEPELIEEAGLSHRECVEAKKTAVVLGIAEYQLRGMPRVSHYHMNLDRLTDLISGEETPLPAAVQPQAPSEQPVLEVEIEDAPLQSYDGVRQAVQRRTVSHTMVYDKPDDGVRQVGTNSRSGLGVDGTEMIIRDVPRDEYARGAPVPKESSQPIPISEGVRDYKGRLLAAAGEFEKKKGKRGVSDPYEAAGEQQRYWAARIASVMLQTDINPGELTRLPKSPLNECIWKARDVVSDIQSGKIKEEDYNRAFDHFRTKGGDPYRNGKKPAKAWVVLSDVAEFLIKSERSDQIQTRQYGEVYT